MSSLPLWDLTPAFPSLDSPRLEAAFARILEEIAALHALMDEERIRRGTPLSAEVFESLIRHWNALLGHLETLDTYLTCLCSTDATNEVAKARQSQLETAFVTLGQLEVRLLAWVGSGDTQSLLRKSEIAREHKFWISRARELAAHQMSEDEENLAAALAPMGLGGWAKLHSNLSALLVAEVQIENCGQTLPMSEIRALATHPNRIVRENAFEAEIAAWRKNELFFAAALNGVKGFQRELHLRRGYSDDVAPTLAYNSISAPILDAMQSACQRSFSDFRRYFRAKARMLGTATLSWCDLFAPLGETHRRWEWSEAREFLRENFAVYSPRLAAFSERCFEENWIDAPPRIGKSGGAYCIQLFPGVSRILTNWSGSAEDVATLAHELGHAYHNLCLENRTPLQSQIPMTLAETASIFCETLVFESAVDRASAGEKIALLDAHLAGAAQVVVDIHSRFLFEKAVFAKRRERELSPTELRDLMTDAQNATYGEAVAPKHPFMWAVKGHYYGPTFYNYPYTFGLLFGLGLYAKFLELPDDFHRKYDDFLSRGAMASAQTLGEEFGFDVSDPEFWSGSLRVLEHQIDEFEALTLSLPPTPPTMQK